MMVCDWSEIGQTTVRDVTVFTEYCTYVTFCDTADKEETKASNSSSFKMDASKEIKSMKLCKFSLMSYTYW